MASGPWSAEDEALLRQLVAEQLGFTTIASKLGRSPGAVAKKSQALGLSKPNRDALPWSSEEQRAAMVLNYQDFHSLYPDRTYGAWNVQRTKLRVPVDLALVDYTRLVEEVEGDAVICACVHVPQTDPTMWSRALAIGERDRIENLIIAGDIVTGDMFSHWDVRESWDFDRELESLYLHLYEALSVYKYIYITPGNHVSNRIAKVSNGHIRLQHLIDMAGLTEADRARIFTTDIDFLRLTSGEETFLVGHATNYSNIDGRVSMFYAEKEECHVITGNGHRFGQQATKSGRWFSWDIGTLADPRYMGYAQRALTKFPKMLQSFCTVRNGAVKMYAAGPPITDWVAELGTATAPAGGRPAAARNPAVRTARSRLLPRVRQDS